MPIGTAILRWQTSPTCHSRCGSGSCSVLLHCDPLQCAVPGSSLYQPSSVRSPTYEEASPTFIKQECMAFAGECDGCDASDLLDHTALAADRPCQVCSLARACGCCPGTNWPALSASKPCCCDLQSLSLDAKLCRRTSALSESLHLMRASSAFMWPMQVQRAHA